MARKLTRIALAISSAAVVLSLTASLAMAGEVKGPPNQIDNTNVTGAVGKANSACAASGLNDFDTHDPVRADASRRSRPPRTPGSTTGCHTVPGHLGLCRGGTGER